VREHSKGKGVDAVQVELPLSVRTGSDQRREAIIQVEKTTFNLVFAGNYFCFNLGDGRGTVGLLSAALRQSGPIRDGKLCVRMCIASANIT
jgi:hypothetical protein